MIKMKMWGLLLLFIVGSCFAETPIHEQIDSISNIMMTVHMLAGPLMSIAAGLYVVAALGKEMYLGEKGLIAFGLMSCMSISWGVFFPPWHFIINEHAKKHDNIYYPIYGMAPVFIAWFMVHLIPILTTVHFAKKSLQSHRARADYFLERLINKPQRRVKTSERIPDHKGDATCVVCKENTAENVSHYICGHNFACRSCFPPFMAKDHKQCPRCRANRVY